MDFDPRDYSDARDPRDPRDRDERDRDFDVPQVRELLAKRRAG